MDDFGMLTKDFGLRPQGKSAPMKSSGIDRRNRPASNDIFNDVVYGGTPKFTNNNSKSTPSISDSDYDLIFNNSSTNNNNNNEEFKIKPKSNSNLNSPVYDKPLYDDGDIFASISQPSKKSLQSDQFDDLLGSLGRTEKAESIDNRSDKSSSSRGLDDLIPGFGSGSPASINRRNSDPSPTSTGKTNKKYNAVDDPFVVLESLSTPVASSKSLFTDPLEEISKISKSRSTKSGVSSPSGDVFGDIDSLNSFSKSPPAFVKETNNRKKGRNPSEEGSSVGSARGSVSREPLDESSFGYSESQPQKMPFNDRQESHQAVHDISSVSRNNRRSFDQTTSPSSRTESMYPKSEEHVHYADDIWLTVSEIPLFTPVTKAPPPSRPPPPIPTRATKSERGSFASSARTFDNDFSSSSNSAKYSQNIYASRNKEFVQVDKDEQDLDEKREREEEEREQRRVEKERMREIEREKARQAVERANKEAGERAASEARLKAERAAVQRAQTEARERATVEVRERAERAAAEKAAKEKAEKEAQEKAAVAKAQAEARRRAERASVERVTAEARERAAADARERAAVTAAAAKMNQQKNDNDLDSFFSMGSRPSSAPKERETSNDSATDPLSQGKRGPGGHNVRKASSTTNFVDDLSSVFGAATPAGEFQDVEGETEERRRARLERQQHTQERAAEKKQRDQQILKEQEEKQEKDFYNFRCRNQALGCREGRKSTCNAINVAICSLA